MDWFYGMFQSLEMFMSYSCCMLFVTLFNKSTRGSKICYEPSRDKTNKMACAPSEDSDQPGHPLSLIRVFAVCMKKAWVFSYPLSAQRRLWSDWADAQADLSLRWAHSHFVGFVMRQLLFVLLVVMLFLSFWNIVHFATHNWKKKNSQ